MIGNLALLFSGALAPLDGLGGLFVLMKYSFPMTWGIALLRQLAVSDGVQFSGGVIGFGAQSVVMLSIGGLAFSACLQRAKQQGALAVH